MFPCRHAHLQIRLGKIHDSAALDRFSARSNTFESYQDLMVNEEKTNLYLLPYNSGSIFSKFSRFFCRRQLSHGCRKLDFPT